MIVMSKAQARDFLLCHQYLKPPHSLYGKAGILEFINRVRCIQFDPLNIVGHNQELVLQSRVKDFHPTMLRELLYKERKLVDAWDKNMSIFPVEDWPCFSRFRDQARHNLGHAGRPAFEVLPQVREALAERGPLSSLDLDLGGVVDWSWAPTRISRAALESMYFWGELIVYDKINTRKVYDFAHLHISPEILDAPDPNISDDDYFAWYVKRRIGSIGLAANRSGDTWLGVSNLKGPQRNAAFGHLLAREEITEVAVEGVKTNFYARSEDLVNHYATCTSDNMYVASVIAPLDNLMWDRKLIEEIFDFSYRWEVYKPAQEREYGYYTLPILMGDKFVARFEPLRNKKTKQLVIKGWWWEEGYSGETLDKLTKNALTTCLTEFALFTGMTDTVVHDDVVRKVMGRLATS